MECIVLLCVLVAAGVLLYLHGLASERKKRAAASRSAVSRRDPPVYGAFPKPGPAVRPAPAYQAARPASAPSSSTSTRQSAAIGQDDSIDTVPWTAMMLDSREPVQESYRCATPAYEYKDYSCTTSSDSGSSSSSDSSSSSWD